MLFSHCKYCYYVGLYKDDDNRRMEELWIYKCQFDEKNWKNMMEIVANMKTVMLSDMKMEEKEWVGLVDVMEHRMLRCYGTFYENSTQ